MAFLSDKTWERHANPWSGWTRVVSMPLLMLGLYFQNIWILIGVVLWTIINPMLFPKPKSTQNWMSKGVLGEKLYYKDGKKLKNDLPSLLNLVNVPVFLLFLYFGWQQQLAPMILSGLLTSVIKFWFIDRMVLFYDQHHS